MIIPTFNRASLLRRSLESVAAQTLPPLEVIVVDDGSTDATERMLKEDFPGIVTIHQSNQGVSRARNAGIENARGEWLALLDSDDEWLPSKLAVQAQALSANRDFNLCHTNELWIRDGKRVNPKRKHEKSGGWIYEKCLPLCLISPSSVLIHRAVFEDVGFFDENLPACEDYDLWLRICARYPVLFLDQFLIRKYGGHGDQLSRKYWGMDRFRIDSLDKMLSSGVLDGHARAATVKVMVCKLRILLAGARKRRNRQLAEACSKKIERYEQDAAAAHVAHG